MKQNAETAQGVKIVCVPQIVVKAFVLHRFGKNVACSTNAPTIPAKAERKRDESLSV